MSADITPPGGRGTRRTIVAMLSASPTGMTASELARALGVHPNGVRKQLRALVREGAVGAEREASGRRGRPAVRYRAADEAREAAAARRLAALLVELVAETGLDEARVEAFGRRQAPRLAAADDGRTALLGLFTAMGFAPHESTGARAMRQGALDVVLGHCPFRDAVRAEGGRAVCVLHRGLSAGLLEMTPGGRLTGFEIHPPEEAGCRITAEGLGPAGDDGSR